MIEALFALTCLLVPAAGFALLFAAVYFYGRKRELERDVDRLSRESERLKTIFETVRDERREPWRGTKA